MITLTRANGQPVLLNCDLIEMVESNDDDNTIIVLTTGNTVIVREPLSEIEAKVVAFKQRTLGTPAP